MSNTDSYATFYILHTMLASLDGMDDYASDDELIAVYEAMSDVQRRAVDNMIMRICGWTFRQLCGCEPRYPEKQPLYMPYLTAEMEAEVHKKQVRRGLRLVIDNEG